MSETRDLTLATIDDGQVITGEVIVDIGPTSAIPELVNSWLLEYTSANTRAAYRRDIALWLDFCLSSDLHPVTEPSRTHVAAWNQLLHARGEKSATRARRLGSVSAWYVWLADQGHRNDDNPVAGLDRRHRPRMVPTTHTSALTRDEAELLLAAADVDGGAARLRTAAIVATLLYCGLRVSELVNADVDAIGHDRGYTVLRVLGKGEEPRTVPLPAPVLRRLEPYLTTRVDLAADRLPTRVAGIQPRRPLFTTSTGRRMRRGDIWALLHRLAATADIKVRMSPHVLRATCATLARDAGATLDAIQELLGHANIRTTAGYIKRTRSLDQSPALTLGGYLRDPADLPLPRAL